MTEEAKEELKPWQKLGSAIGTIESRLRHADPGELAALRRLAGGKPSLAYWRVMAECRVDEDLRTEGREALWPPILAALAQIAPLGEGGQPLGRVLAETGYAEARLLRLLRADATSVGDEIGTVARWLAAKGVRARGYELADFALSRLNADAGSLDRAASAIAKAYFTPIAKAEVKA
ncbi:hypothetical protein [Zavarzinia compransoris]|uniref:Type I-E CRISPR-associated protein Cse2/CasB n=1 Tax=Zavarzinia compransoris TaxID=1264899 RepID=A0A317DW94_9PROT|nr:hypothetical protein [Zavarzinia compransoris]PWR18801.1 hypothetical protein DKG75_17625 [Zavarzinia compransoris]TDP48787.1 CRISPR system Cascade subunit CasB [Zavarzinia compransoris]